MKLLFDQGTPMPLRRFLHPHEVDTAGEQGWSVLENGNLIAAAEAAGYDAMITTDQNLKYQQNLKRRTMAIVVLKKASWPRIRKAVDHVVSEIESIKRGEYKEITID
jgi:predicted nuclease of predicted toxin-antitoxin system